MLTHITDSLYHHSHNPDFFCSQELCKWTLVSNKNDYNLVKKEIRKMDFKNDDIIAIVSPSNYKLLFDLKEFNVKRFYRPEFYERRETFEVDYRKIDKLFENFLKRSYISYLNYEKLQNLGLNRIEQFVICLAFILFKGYSNSDNLIIDNKVYKIEKIEKIRTVKIKNKQINFLKCLRLLHLNYGMSFDEATSFLFQEYSYLRISDVFNEEGFVPLKKIELKGFNSILYKLIKEEIEVEEILVHSNGKKFLVKKMINPNQDFINYYGFQSKDYKVGDVFVPENKFNVDFIFELIKHIMPLKDFVLTLKSLIKLDRIKERGCFLSINEDIIHFFNIKYNKEWINIKNWEKIYLQQDFTFNNILNEIDCSDLEFVCPCCGEKKLSISPARFFCKIDCGFSFYRYSLRVVGINSISKEKMIEALHFKKIFVKNKSGKNFVANLKNRKSFHFLSLKN